MPPMGRRVRWQQSAVHTTRLRRPPRQHLQRSVVVRRPPAHDGPDETAGRIVDVDDHLAATSPLAKVTIRASPSSRQSTTKTWSQARVHGADVAHRRPHILGRAADDRFLAMDAMCTLLCR